MMPGRLLILTLRLALLGCFILGSIVFVAAQEENLPFKNIGLSQGLSNVKVWSILQDSKGFMWFGTESGLNRFDGYRFKVYKSISNDSTSLRSNYISYLYEDREGNLWVGTEVGLHLFDRELETFTFFPHYNLSDGKIEATINSIYQDRNKNLWIGTRNGVCRYNKKKNSFTNYHLGFTRSSNPIGVIAKSSFIEDNDGNLWVGTTDGMVLYDVVRDSFKMIEHNLKEITYGNISAMTKDNTGKIWIGTSLGKEIFSFDPKSRKFERFPLFQDARFLGIFDISLVESNLLWVLSSIGLFVINQNTQETIFYRFNIFMKVPYKICKDRGGGFWVPGPFKGVYYYNTYQDKFQYHNYKTKTLINPHGFWGISDNGHPSIWFTSEKKLIEFDLLRNKVHEHNFTFNDLIALGSVLLVDSKGYIWLQVSEKGKKRYSTIYEIRSLQKREVVKHQTQTAGMMMYEDQHKNIFLSLIHANTDSIYIYNRNNKQFKGFPDSEFYKKLLGHIGAFHLDDHNHLWLGTFSGLYLYDLIKKEFKPIQILDGDDSDYCKTLFWTIFEDSHKNIWVGTHKGLRLVDKEKLVFKGVWREKDGLPHDQIDGILEDSKGNLWISTDNGLTKFNSITETFKNYNQSDGLTSREYYVNSSAKLQNGEMIFRGAEGIDIFHPDSIRDNPYIPPIVITDFQLFNKSVPISGSVNDTLGYPSPLKKGIVYTDKIILQHRQNDFAFEFSALNYLNPEENQYKYQLENYDENWISTSANLRYARYTNLSPGKYIFKVIGSNNDGIWNNEGTSIQIIIHPPWYWAWWSKSIYALLLLGGIYSGYRFQLKRRLQQAETLRLKELDLVKTKLYTNITHEFRTPLTIISGMADQIKADAAKYLEEGVAMIKRNSQQLLHLVNQMLELNKLESGTLTVNKIQADIIGYLRYLTESFHSLAATKRIYLEFTAEQDELIMDYDPEKIQHILVNLIANAIKFTPEGGEIEVLAKKSEHSFLLTVQDNGIGIAAEKLPFIFDRFYQADDEATRKAEGTGIGLALTKELVQLLGGTISVESSTGEGSTFTVSLPISHTAPIEKIETFFAPIDKETSSALVNTSTLLAVTPETYKNADFPLILIVEDNQDVVHYLQTCLIGKYQIEVAKNGQEGIEKALAQVPDLIISDVMMPKKDGFELCQTLKTDERTSHIPIILLTAKGDMDSKLEGLAQGADAYLVKPFHKAELLVRIQKLLELRQKLQAYYLALVGIKTAESSAPLLTVVEREEQHFILKVKTILEQHLEDSDFTVEVLCIEMGMSNTQLYRKLVALTGMSANPLLRSIRLAKAKSLLQYTTLNISEIAYETGFTDPHYFSKMFKQDFGFSPKSYRDIMKK